MQFGIKFLYYIVGFTFRNTNIMDKCFPSNMFDDWYLVYPYNKMRLEMPFLPLSFPSSLFLWEEMMVKLLWLSECSCFLYVLHNFALFLIFLARFLNQCLNRKMSSPTEKNLMVSNYIYEVTLDNFSKKCITLPWNV